MKCKFTKDAAVALISLLIVAAIVLILGISANSLGINEIQLAQREIFHSQSLGNAQACIEETGYQLKRNPNFSGATLNLGTINCTISVTANGNTRTATITGISNSYTKRIEVIFEATTNGQATNVSLTSWREI